MLNQDILGGRRKLDSNTPRKHGNTVPRSFLPNLTAEHSHWRSTKFCGALQTIPDSFPSVSEKATVPYAGFNHGIELEDLKVTLRLAKKEVHALTHLLDRTQGGAASVALS